LIEKVVFRKRRYQQTRRRRLQIVDLSELTAIFEVQRMARASGGFFAGLRVAFLMFESLHACLLSQCALAAERPEGVAFFRAAKDLYQMASISYVCINISIGGRSRYFTHCVYSDTCVKHFTSNHAIRFELKNDNGAGSDSIDVPANGAVKPSPTHVILRLSKRRGETAFFGIISATEDKQQSEQHDTMLREFRILANYFHGHVLRMNGYDSNREILVSARELDCLKWTAAGKTASEASVILGITERTVRFHLNAAREKLDCVTTTQAVARAIANQLIEI
jgi:DNA-binding CsgD family transcriptional regulator